MKLLDHLRLLWWMLLLAALFIGLFWKLSKGGPIPFEERAIRRRGE